MKITKSKGSPEKIKMRTRVGPDGLKPEVFEWWKADDKKVAQELCATAAYLKTSQIYRIRQMAASIRLYSGLSVYSYAGSNVSRMDQTKSLPDDRPTFNLISACVDTLVARLTQAHPQPKFLTDNADYKERHLAQQLNQFVQGELYQTKCPQKVTKMLRDGCVMGPGVLKVYEGDNKRVCVDRVMATDLYTDETDALNGDPQQLIQLALVDRDKLMATSPKSARNIISDTPQSYPDNAPDSGRTTSDKIMVAEAWRLPNLPDEEDPNYVPGRHTIATVQGTVVDEEWNKSDFPFVIFNYDDPFLGFWGRGIGTRLFGTQLSLNRILHTISRAITLVGVPRVFIEQSSKVVKAHQDNQIGTIVTYSGTKPSYEVSQSNASDLYAERDHLIQYGFQQEGVSSMQATSQKPEGLDSGTAIRSYDDIANDRFAVLGKKYEQIYIDLAYKITDVAMDIAKRDGKYQTVYPNKDGTREIDLPAMKFLKDPFVIQCFDESSLPTTPAGRRATVTEQVQAGMITIKEGRRLLRYPDLEQNERLANASEERILKILDDIVEHGKYTPPDMFMDLTLANELVVQYFNLYVANKLEEEKADMLRDFFSQVQALTQSATTPMANQPQALAPQASPEAPPTSPLIPNSPTQQAS